MKKIISAVLAAAVMLSSATVVKDSYEPAEAADDDMIKIMCIGDSITDGYVPEYMGSYRKFLYHDLTEKGYKVDMVGVKDGGWTPVYTDPDTGESFEYDNENVGYSGYAVESYSGRSGIYEKLVETDCLKKYAPDIVTLQIGTNDIIDNRDVDETYASLEKLVDYILENIPEKSALFIAEIPPVDPNRPEVYDWFANYRHSADWQTQYTDEEAAEAIELNIKIYAANVCCLASSKNMDWGYSHDDFSVTNENGWTTFLTKVGVIENFEAITDVKTQLFDGVHPNNIGYRAIGKQYSEAILNYLEGKSTAPDEQPTTEAPTEPVEADKFTVSDLVKMSRYLLGCTKELIYTEAELAKYDHNKDGEVDVYDLVLGRKALLKAEELLG
ncbi:MAG: hypothetical protein J6B75_06810 [Ruminococcus sp.]|nr:hypothetical protein [Ruminococcus sp.]